MLLFLQCFRLPLKHSTSVSSFRYHTKRGSRNGSNAVRSPTKRGLYCWNRHSTMASLGANEMKWSGQFQNQYKRNSTTLSCALSRFEILLCLRICAPAASNLQGYSTISLTHRRSILNSKRGRGGSSCKCQHNHFQGRSSYSLAMNNPRGNLSYFTGQPRTSQPQSTLTMINGKDPRKIFWLESLRHSAYYFSCIFMSVIYLRIMEQTFLR